MNAVSSPPANSADATDRETPDNTAVAETQDRRSTSRPTRPALEGVPDNEPAEKIQITGQ